MGNPTGFIEYRRKTAPERQPADRIKDWRDFHLTLPESELREQAGRCMDCAVPFCQTGANFGSSVVGCPVHNLIPEWNDLVYRGRWKEALERLLATNNFPEFTGRACPAPCEGSCVAAVYESPVSIKTIEQAIIDRGFAEGWIVPRPPRTRTGKKVAVVGSGPAGLACADELNKKGHQVTVFERHDRIGGLLTYGIPKMKIEQSVVERRVQLMREEGIEFVTNAEIGKQIPPEQLKAEFDAIVLCTGATRPRDLDIPGRELGGIHFAMEFLHRNTKSLLDSNLQDGQYISAAGKDVVVIGGGDTATDCVSTAVRHGCRSLVQFDIYPRKPEQRADGNPWPLWPVVHKTDSGQLEAAAVYGKDPREFAISAKSFIHDDKGQVTGIRSVRVNVTKDEAGRAIREEIPGTEEVWPAQLVLLAIGFNGPEQELLAQMNVAVDRHSRIDAKPGDYRTNVEGVFAAGDARRGQSLIVWAIREGREAAQACHRYLSGLE
jgi:glutamate synthase (NADPH/NADH) small chain